MLSVDEAENWETLAKELNIRLPGTFLSLITRPQKQRIAWKFLSAPEAIRLMAELDVRFDYPGREWRGIPFARSTVSEDVACFDLTTPTDQEAMVLPIRDWHGPRWELSGEIKTFYQWLTQDSKGHLS